MDLSVLEGDATYKSTDVIVSKTGKSIKQGNGAGLLCYIKWRLERRPCPGAWVNPTLQIVIWREDDACLGFYLPPRNFITTVICRSLVRHVRPEYTPTVCSCLFMLILSQLCIRISVKATQLYVVVRSVWFLVHPVKWKVP